MAIENEQETPGGHLLLLTALLALLGAGTVAFARVFAANGTSVRLALAAAGALALGALLERRHVLVAALGSLVGLALVTGWLIYPETTWYGLPTFSTWDSALRSLSAVSRTAEVHVAPAPTVRPLFLAALAAVWASGFAAHALAVRARSPFLSLLPPASLMAFAGVVMSEGSRPVYVLPFLAACLAVLFADALYRVGQWGPLTTWRHAGTPAWAVTSWTKGARRVVAASLGVALFAPWILPGFDSASLLDVRGGEGGTVTIDPIVDIRPKLLNQPGTEFFRVRSARASYWRFVGLEQFNGTKWTSGDLYAEHGIETTGGELPVTDVDPSFASRSMKQRIEFDGAIQAWLPAAYPVVTMDPVDEALRFDPQTGTVVLPEGTYRGFSYTVTSLEIVPTPEDLDRITSLEGDYPDRLTALPFGTPAEIFEIAREFAGEGSNPYRRVLNIQNRLRRGVYRYDPQAQPGHGVNDILYFLNESRSGYCEQFAGTMAVLVRALGYPARVAVGFTPGAVDPNDSSLRHVTGQNAHAWVEVLFPGWGWLAFEPTPTRLNPVASRYTEPSFRDPADPGLTVLPPDIVLIREQRIRQQEAPFQGGPECAGPLAREGCGADPNREAGAEVDRPFDWPLFAIRAALVAALIAIVGIPLWKLARRRRAVSRARDPRERILAAYEVMADRAGDVGLGRRPAETLQEYRERLRDRVQFSDGHLDRLTGLTAGAAYSDASWTPEHEEEAMACARQVTRDIRKSTGRARLLVGWFRVERLTRGR